MTVVSGIRSELLWEPLLTSRRLVCYDDICYCYNKFSLVAIMTVVIFITIIIAVIIL